LWASDVPVFEAGVLTCAPVLRKGAEQAPVRRTHGPEFAPFLPRPVTGADLAGEWSFMLVEALGVPEVTLSSPRTVGDLWRVLAVLLAPPVTAHAIARYAGTALTMQAVKLSASQVAAIPLPTVEEPWAEAASVVRRAQADAAARPALLREAGALMCAAYEVDVDVLPWWEDRLRKRR
jgi:hypothetical protein